MKQNAQVMPMISVDSVDQARTFYVDKLGFGHMMGMLGKDGQLDFCTVMLGGAKVMLMRPQERTGGTNATSSKRPVNNEWRHFRPPEPCNRTCYGASKRLKSSGLFPDVNQLERNGY